MEGRGFGLNPFFQSAGWELRASPSLMWGPGPGRQGGSDTGKEVSRVCSILIKETDPRKPLSRYHRLTDRDKNMAGSSMDLTSVLEVQAPGPGRCAQADSWVWATGWTYAGCQPPSKNPSGAAPTGHPNVLQSASWPEGGDTLEMLVTRAIASLVPSPGTLSLLP